MVFSWGFSSGGIAGAGSCDFFDTRRLKRPDSCRFSPLKPVFSLCTNASCKEKKKKQDCISLGVGFSLSGKIEGVEN